MTYSADTDLRALASRFHNLERFADDDAEQARYETELRRRGALRNTIPAFDEAGFADPPHRNGRGDSQAVVHPPGEIFRVPNNSPNGRFDEARFVNELVWSHFDEATQADIRSWVDREMGR